MDAHIVVGKITAAASDFFDLRFSSGLNLNASADRVAIGARAFQAERNPMILISTLVTEQAGTVIHVDHEYIDVPVVVEVAESSAARRLWNQ